MLNIALWSNIAALSGATAPGFDPSSSNASITFSNSNKTATTSDTTFRSTRFANGNSRAVGSVTSQYTLTVTTVGSAMDIGLIDTSKTITADGHQLYNDAMAVMLVNNGIIRFSGTTVASNGAWGYTNGDQISVRIVNNFVGFAKNGTWLNGFNPSTGAGGVDVSVGTNGGTNGITNAVPAVTLDNSNVTIDASQW